MELSHFLNKINSHKKILTAVAGLCFCLTAVFADPFFSGNIGVGTSIVPIPKKIVPSITMDAYFAGQFDLSPTVFLRTGMSVYTDESIIGNNIFQRTKAYFNLDEVSVTYRGSMGSISHYLAAYIGQYDPIGSDIFLRRQFGVPSFASKLTDSACGDNKAKIYDMSGIGFNYTLRFPLNMAAGFYAYYNKGPDWTKLVAGVSPDEIKKADDVESINLDLRFAGAWSSVSLDLSLGFNLPMEKQMQTTNGEENVILLIRRADMHSGINAFFGSSNSTSLLFQAGFTKLIIDPNKKEEEKTLKLEDIYLLFEPRFVTSAICFSFSLFNMPLSTYESLFYINSPVGASVSLYSPWFNISGNKSQFGLMATMGSKKNLQEIIEDITSVPQNLSLLIVPYGTMYLGGGIFNFALSVDALEIEDWNTFLDNFSVIASYKVLL